MSIFQRIYLSLTKSVNPYFSSREPAKLILLGLDASGKTTILYSIKKRHDEVVTTIPTIGFNVEMLEFDTTQFICWDVGGCDKIRPLWRHYTTGLHALVFVVDSNDWDRIENAKEELETFLRDDTTAGVPILVLANKQDLPKAKSIQEILQALNLPAIIDRPWHIHPTSATYNTGLREAFSWLQSVLQSSGRNNGAKYTSTVGISSTTYKIADDSTSKSDQESVHSTAIVDIPRYANIFYPEQIKDGVIPDDLVQKKNEEINHRNLGFSIVSAWVQRSKSADDIERDDTLFLSKVEDCTLESWDHYTHIRLGWIVLMKHGYIQGMEVTAKVIRNFISHSPRTNGKSFHATMTRFWVHMIGVGISDMYRNGRDKKENFTFTHFLENMVPKYELWDHNLFKLYFSTAFMFSPEARAEVVRPDINSLPWMYRWRTKEMVKDHIPMALVHEATGYNAEAYILHREDNIYDEFRKVMESESSYHNMLQRVSS